MQQNGNPIVMYSRPTCPLDAPVKNALSDADVPFVYVDIRGNAEARLTIREINRGYESVPTLVFPDGSTLTEPSARALQAKLRDLGAALPPGGLRASYLQGVLRSPLGWIQIGALLALLWGILRLLGVI